MQITKKTSKLCVIGLSKGNSPVTGEFPAQKASDAEYVSIWWRHHDIQHLSCWIYSRNNKMMITFYAISQPRDDTGTWSRRAKTCFMITSSNGSIFRVTGLCAGNSPVTGEFPALRPVTRSFDVLFDMRLDKRLSKQSCGWWFKTSSHSLWRHRNDSVSTAALHNVLSVKYWCTRKLIIETEMVSFWWKCRHRRHRRLSMW